VDVYNVSVVPTSKPILNIQRGERVVLEHLMAQLPDKAHVYYNIDLLTEEYRNGGGARVHLKEGEIDAIVLPLPRLQGALLQLMATVTYQLADQWGW